ncbi:MAG: marR family protein [Micavibrio sp.]|nr:marR family protein [Micavibrio sp.]
MAQKPNKTTITTLPFDANVESKVAKVGHVIDHLVDALGGEPACTIRRAVILADIDENPGTTQAGITQRLKADKSTLNRDIEWLVDYCCIRKKPGQDGRETLLFTEGYSRKHMESALKYFDNSHKVLKNFLIRYMSLFGEHKPTLRDAKIVASIGDADPSNRQQVFQDLYNGPVTTDNRAINNLIELGLIERKGTNV